MRTPGRAGSRRAGAARHEQKALERQHRSSPRRCAGSAVHRNRDMSSARLHRSPVLPSLAVRGVPRQGAGQQSLLGLDALLESSAQQACYGDNQGRAARGEREPQPGQQRTCAWCLIVGRRDAAPCSRATASNAMKPANPVYPAISHPVPRRSRSRYRYVDRGTTRSSTAVLWPVERAGCAPLPCPGWEERPC